jgi:hypothetical protein
MTNEQKPVWFITGCSTGFGLTEQGCLKEVLPLEINGVLRLHGALPLDDRVHAGPTDGCSRAT